MAEYLGYEFVDAKDLIFIRQDGGLNEDDTYKALANRIDPDKRVVIPGFYGMGPNGEIKTFERGGSDITGSILANGMDASLYENWTDVNGVMTADPRKDPSAATIPFLCYDELLKITQDGAQVYHRDAINPAKKKNIPIQIKNTNQPEERGTLIMKKESIQIALLGFGTVVRGVEAILRENKEHISSRIYERTGKFVDIEVKRILVRDITKYPCVFSEQLTLDFNDILDDPDISIVVELIGGDTVAKDYMISALKSNKHVVTANKAAIAASSGALEQLAKEQNLSFLFEAAVAGAIPVIRVINESLEANHILSIQGIVNGTTNYILSSMTNEQKNYSDALSDAQALGFAEADPTSDVEGFDSMYKLCILSKQAFGKYPQKENISRTGITSIRIEDIERATSEGSVIKLIGSAKIVDGEPYVEVKPTPIPKNSALGSVDGAGNAILITCDNAGDIFLQGQGAGSRPTASAVISDIINLVKEIV